MAMNKARYNALPPDLKKVIDNNSGLATSGWLGKTQHAIDLTGRKAAVTHKTPSSPLEQRRHRCFAAHHVSLNPSGRKQ